MAQTIKILPHMCDQQRQDVDDLMYAADEIGAAAVSVIAQGGMGYNLLLEAREKFRKTLLRMTTHYRVCVEEEESSN